MLGAPGLVHPLRLIVGAHRSTVPPVSVTEIEDGVDRRKLVDGEVSSETPGTIVFHSSTRTQGYPRLGRWLTEASSSVSMVDGGGRTVARRPSPATTRPSKHGYGFHGL